MALLFCDSFQGGDSSSKWGNSSNLSRATATPRTTGAAYGIGSGSNRKTITAAAEVFVAFGAYYASATANLVYATFRGDSNATTHITVTRNASRLLEVRLGTTAGTVLATGTTTIADVTWTHLQIRVKIADSGGVVQVRLNGSGSNEIDFSGDTKNAGTAASVDNIEFNSGGSGSFVADTVLLDTSGSANNTWPGDVKVVALTPSGDGNSSQLTGSDGNQVSNYQQVDETPFSSTDYNGSPTAGNKDTYALTDLASGITDIRAVQVCASIAKSDAGAVAAKTVLRSGGTDNLGSSLTLSTTYQTFTTLYETDPATSTTWSASGVNALEAGMQVA